MYSPVSTSISTDGNTITSVFSRTEGDSIYTKTMVLNTITPSVSWTSNVSNSLSVLGSIGELSDTATESDLVAGNYLALDGATGTKKLPADAVAKDSDVANIQRRIDSLDGEGSVISVDEDASFSLSVGTNNYYYDLMTELPAGVELTIRTGDFSALSSASCSFKLMDVNGNKIASHSLLPNQEYTFPAQQVSVVKLNGYFNAGAVTSAGNMSFEVVWTSGEVGTGRVNTLETEMEDVQGRVSSLDSSVSENTSSLNDILGVDSREFFSTSASVVFAAAGTSGNHSANFGRTIFKNRAVRISIPSLDGIIASGKTISLRLGSATNSNVCNKSLYVDTATEWTFKGEEVTEDITRINIYVAAANVIGDGTFDFTAYSYDGEYVEGTLPKVSSEANYSFVAVNNILKDYRGFSVYSSFDETLYNFGRPKSGKRIELKRVVSDVFHEGSQGVGCNNNLCAVATSANSSGLGRVAFIDMRWLKVLDIVDYTFPVNCHNNAIFFGNYKYNESDPYNVMYVSSFHDEYQYLIAYRINVSDFGKFSVSEIQRITLPAKTSTYDSVDPDCYLGNDGYLYVLGNKTNEEKYTIAKFNMPLISEGNITLTENDILDKFEVNRTGTRQGGFIRQSNGCLYLMRSAGVEVIDIANKLNTPTLYFDMGNYEMEGCFEYAGNMYVSAVSNASENEDGKKHTDIWLVNFIEG